MKIGRGDCGGAVDRRQVPARGGSRCTVGPLPRVQMRIAPSAPTPPKRALASEGRRQKTLSTRLTQRGWQFAARLS